MNLVASDKSYALGIRGSTDNLEIAYKGDVDADLDDTTLVTITTGGNVTTTGTITAATGSTIGNLTLANGSITDTSGTISFGDENLTATGTITGNSVGTLGTAAQTNITSVGTLTALTVDNVSINGTTNGHTSDTDLMTLADGSVTFTGSTVIATADINGGAIDGTIGGATPAAGTFTTLTANDQLIVNAGVSITGDTTDEITLNVKGVASQTADLLTVENSDGTDKLTVSSAGVTTAASLVAATADINGGSIDGVTMVQILL